MVKRWSSPVPQFIASPPCSRIASCPSMAWTIVARDSRAHICNTSSDRREPRPRPSFRAASAMFSLLLVPLGITMLLAAHILGATAQGTGAVCQSGFEWMSNSRGQSPCLVSSWLFTPCSTPSDSYVNPLPSGYHYATPLNTTASANPCRCNTVLFSTIAACATCQGGQDFIVPWFIYSQNCSTIYIQKYPENIPSGTAIPAWAYLEVRVNNTFDPAAAQAVAAQNLPESSAPPAPSTTQAASSTDTPTSLSMTTNGAASGTSTATGDASSPGSKKSNAGAVAGGVIGGLTGFVLVGLTASFIVRLRARRNAVTGDTLEHTNYSVDAQSWEKSPVTSVSTHKFYDPNDPRTFPAQDPYASRPVQVSTGYLAADSSAGVLGSNFTDGQRPRGGGGTTQNPYRGAPEL
ncbi:hypothetical protein V8D89_005452 [Ganoderma adspersum]